MGWIRSGERQITAGQLERRAAKAAAAFERLGVGEGDGIALYLRNDIAFLEASFGAGMLGAYPVPVNWHYTPDEAAYLLRDSGVKVVVIHADLVTRVRAAIPDGVTVVVVDTPPEIATAYGIADVPPIDALRWDALLDASEPRAAPPRPAPSTIIYTSGTTGRPKGVKRAAFTPEQAEAAAQMLALSYGFAKQLDPGLPRRADAVTTAVLGPLYHSAPNAHAGFAIRSGANLLILPRFDPEELLRLIEAYRITHLNMAPIMLVRLAKLPEEVRRLYDLSSLEFVVHAAAPCPPEVKRAMIDWWGPIIHEYYGSTEMGNVTFCTAEEWLAHPGTVGKVMPGAEVRIVDEVGRELPPGEVGEVVGRVCGLNDFTYQNDDAKRRAMDKQGLLSPGDVGYFDTDGFLYLCDRKSDMIISGGVNVYPAEIEAELHKLPEVADCAVFGIPDDEYGERVHAVVALKPGRATTEAGIRTALRSRLAGFKIPRSVDFVTELPREDSGKIFKRKLREPFWADRAGRI